MPGTVITFYSYKGGVGRSFTLANVAVLLARWGHRVLCLDWDLEAPGLHDYFRPMMNAAPASGVVDLIDDFLAGRVRPAAHTTRLTGVKKLDVIAAGRMDDRYAGRVQSIDWDDLYNKGFGDYLELCREKWTSEYDFVLLDSRTGISDIGGICTAHLPDRLVVLFTANVQSMDGAVDIARRADVARDRMPYDRPRLAVLPVLSRFDSREEYARADEWRRICLDKTKGLFTTWLDRDVPPELMSRHLTLPYISYWTFGEELPVYAELTPTADQISYALETVASVIAHHFERTELLAENRDAYVAAVRAEKRTFTREVRVSTPRSTLQAATELVKHLEAHGVHAELSLSGDRSLLGKAEDGARHLCLIVDQEVSRWQKAEVELFVHRTLGQDRRLIPVLTAGTEPHRLPGYVGNLRFLRFGPSRGPAEVAQGLVEQLTGVAGLVDTGDVDLVTLMRQVSDARLRPLLWELVDELVTALTAAVGAGDDLRAQELGADLALAIRQRVSENGSNQHVGVPAGTREAIEWVERHLGSRHQFTGNLGDQARAGEDLG